MTVQSICQREVDLAGPSETAQVAAGRMKARNVGTLMVVDGDRRPIGILTDRDLALRVVATGVSPIEIRVADVMTPDPVTISDRAPIEDALTAMRSRGIRRLIVVGKDRKLVGILSLDDVVVWLGNEVRQLSRVLEKSSPQALKRERAAKVRAARAKVRA